MFSDDHFSGADCVTSIGLSYQLTVALSAFCIIFIRSLYLLVSLEGSPQLSFSLQDNFSSRERSPQVSLPFRDRAFGGPNFLYLTFCIELCFQ